MSREQTFKLWDETIGDHNYDPSITYYPTLCKATKATVVIFPGGGYHALCNREGEGYAHLLNTFGFDAFVVKNRVAPYKFPLPLLDARRAVRFVRANAAKFDIDPEHVAVMGSSAGGHLSALVSTYRGNLEGEGVDDIDFIDYIPNAQILCYPVICMNDDSISHLGSKINFLGENYKEIVETVSPQLIADEKTPRAFIWHTSEDQAVNVINTYKYATKLKELNIDCEVLVYPKGYHGLDVAANTAIVRNWKNELCDWLHYIGFIQDKI